ncbi:MAG: hypothetical protein RLY30_18 [Pseudomonadota bacterium]|jgi:lipopolysaccharide transport system ATP-binding protein
MSSSSVLVQLEAAGKAYRRYATPGARLRDLLGLLPEAHRPVAFEALAPLSLELQAGEALGVVGLNGAGKSTLLQLLAGTLTPSTGRVHRVGRVSALLELGSGFNPDFTGRENIFLNAATLGLSQEEIAQRLDSIIEFSELGPFIDQPVKTYSSGMFVRLAFSVATCVVPDLLIIDEALSVGDGAFARKSFDRVMEIKRAGAAIVFCSHTLFHVEVFCDRALWLHKGRVEAIGPTKVVLGAYQAFLDDLSRPSSADEKPNPEVGLAPAKIVSAVFQINGVVLAHPESEPPASSHFRSDEPLRLAAEVVVQRLTQTPPPRAAVVLSTEAGRILSSHLMPALSPGDVESGPNATLRLQFQSDPVPLNHGLYRLGIYLLCERGEHVIEWVDPVASFRVLHDGPEQGYLRMFGSWAPKRTDQS